MADMNEKIVLRIVLPSLSSFLPFSFSSFAAGRHHRELLAAFSTAVASRPALERTASNFPFYRVLRCSFFFPFSPLLFVSWRLGRSKGACSPCRGYKSGSEKITVVSCFSRSFLFFPLPRS